MDEMFVKHSFGESHLIEWGSMDDPVVLLVHGLGGQAANYLELAEHLSNHFRVLSIDLPGRGKSSWLKGSGKEYCFDVYESVVLQVLDHLSIDSFSWIGTSMGGALGYRMVSGALRERVKKLVVNDIGPLLPESVVPQIITATSAMPKCSSMEELAKTVAGGFEAMAMAPRSLDYWMQRARHYGRRGDDGLWTLHYDPKVVRQLVDHRQDYELLQEFESIEIPILVIRGGSSEVLTDSAVEEMKVRNRMCEILIIDGYGHAPLLDDPSDLAVIDSFLRSKDK